MLTKEHVKLVQECRKGIPFKPQMVRAIQSGQKDTTRRRVREANAPYRADDLLYVKEDLYCSPERMIGYTATGDVNYGEKWKWAPRSLPAMYCSRKASRCVIRVTNVHEEFLLAITRQEAEREGFNTFYEFRDLWRELHGANSWNTKTRVWVIRFEVVLFEHFEKEAAPCS